MKRIRIGLLLACLTMLACFCAGAEETWPPAGKEKGTAACSGCSGNYYFNFEGRETNGWILDLYPQGTMENSLREKPVDTRLIRLSGDEGVGDPFSVIQEAGEWNLYYDQELVQGEGEATYRLEIETEHYWFEEEFTARFRDMKKTTVELLSETISVAAWEPLEGGWSGAEKFLKLEPVEENTYVDFMTPSGEFTAQTDEYEVNWYTFTAKKPGDFPMKICVGIGKNRAAVVVPVTMHAISWEEARAAWEAAWPPADRKEATEVRYYSSYTLEENLNGIYFINGGDRKKLAMGTCYLAGKDGSEEKVTEIHITFISGDEHLRSLIRADNSGNGKEAVLWFHPDEIREPGTAEYRIDMTSEHYWASATAKPVVMDANAVQLELLSSDVYVPLGERVNIHDLYEDRAFVKTEPEFEYRCTVTTEDGAYEEKTDFYQFEEGCSFTAREAGDYPLRLNVSLGRLGYTRSFQIMIHASTETETAAVEGDAPATAMAEEKRKRLIENLRMDPGAGDILAETEDALYVYRLEGIAAGIQKIVPLKAKLTVPATLDGHPVDSIGFRVLENGNELTSLTLENGIRKIEQAAFYGAEHLASAILPESLIEIEGYAFEDCHALREISLPKSLTLGKIGPQAFEGIGLEDLVLSDGTSLMAESLAEYRREGADKTKMSTCADGFEYLIREDGGAIVLDCDHNVPFKNDGVMNLPETLDGHPVREIAQRAFERNSYLREAVLPEGLESIGKEAFRICENLVSVRIPSTVKEIGSRVFLNTALEEIPALPEGVERLANDWFAALEKRDATGKWTYRILADGTAAICGYTYTAKMEFPAEVDGIPVTEITRATWYDGIYKDLEKVKKLILPEGLKTIREEAFDGMKNLTALKLPEGLVEIEAKAFASCALKSITFPSTLRIIGEKAFEDNRLKSLKLPEGLVSVGKEAFHWCGISDLQLPGSLKTIGEGAFESNQLSNLKLPEGLERIGKEAFAYCEVKKLQLPESLKVIGEEAFYSHKLSSLTIPAGVERIGNSAFHPNGNKELKKVTFEGVTMELGKGIFGYDSGEAEYFYRHLEEIRDNGGDFSYDSSNPDNWIDYYAAESRNEVQELTLTCWPGSTADQLYQYHVKKNYLKWGEEHIATIPADPVLQAGLYTPADQIYEIIIPEGVTEIPDSAFAGLITLNRVTLPTTLKTIGERAFADCSALEEITLPKELERIGKGCFSGCGRLTEIALPKGITEIPEEAFLNCSALKQATVQKAVLVRIGDLAFSGCRALTTFKMGKGLESIGAFAFQNSGLKSAQVPETVTEIGEGAFAGTAITSLTLPKGLGEIPKHLCSMCTELKSVKIPAGVRAIGDNAFTYCRSLNGVTLPEGLETIGEGAFMQQADGVQYYYSMTGGKQKYSALSAMKFPASLKTIGNMAFAGCDALTKVSFAKGAQLTAIGNDAFNLCVHLKEISLPDSLETLGASAFMNCVDLQKADLGGGLKTAGKELFKYCKAMKTLKVPESLMEIGENLLEGHGSKLTVTCGEGSAMEAHLQTAYPDVKVVYPKKK